MDFLFTELFVAISTVAVSFTIMLAAVFAYCEQSRSIKENDRIWADLESQYGKDLVDAPWNQK
jgi:hypothetical protein